MSETAVIETPKRRPVRRHPRCSVGYWAREIGVGERTLWRAISAGQLHVTRIGNRVVITPDQWQAFLQQQAAGGAR